MRAALVLMLTLLSLPAAADGRRLLLDCEKQFLKIESLKGTIRTRSVVHGNGEAPGPVEERMSDFTYARFDKVRFENTAPLSHTVIWSGEKLWIWSPQEDAYVEEPAKKVSMLSRTALSVQPGFGIDLLAPVPLDAYRADASPPAENGEVLVTLEPLEKTSPPRARMQFVVDPAKKLVSRIAVSANGTVVSDIRLNAPVELKPGVFFATQVEVRQLLPDGTTLEELRTFERLAADTPVDASRFEFVVPKDATRVPVEALADRVGSRP